MHAHQWIDIGLRAVAICSIVYSILPPYEQFNDWPRFQGYYKLTLIFVQAVALNGRGKLMSMYSSTKTPPPDAVPVKP